ncbi:MAG: hypothetical protein JJE22_13750 [Bacteroidia bacterium]|nr:hypothetical protein [Bacteroidia bacterium]
MKKLIILTVAFLISSPGVFAQLKAGRRDATPHIALYTCLIHSDAIIYKPGKCRFCGMDLNLSQKQELHAKIAKTNTCPINGGVVSNIAGRNLNHSLKVKMKMEVVKLNSYPVNTNVAIRNLDKYSNCGMDMIAKKTK